MDECIKVKNQNSKIKIMKLLQKLDEIVEDPRKTKALIKWMQERGMLDETAIAMWEIEQDNKEALHCKHILPNGESALFDAAGYTECSLCGSSDYPGDKL